MTSTIRSDRYESSTTNGNLVLAPNGTGATVVNGQTMPTAGGLWSGRNMVINGSMAVSQRSVSETGLGTAASYPTLDRYQFAGANTAGRVTMTQTADGPSGIANCLKLACTTADTSVAANEYLFFQTKFEGQNLQRICKGTSDAKQVTVSFWVKGNASATYVVALEDADNTRHCGFTFAVTTSWTRITKTFPADTTGAFDDDNAYSLALIFHLAAGSDRTSGTLPSTWQATVTANRCPGITQFLDSTSRTFFLTGLQMEVGDATPFEHESYSETLQKCQRYYQTINPKVNAIYASGYQNNSERISQVHRLGVEMRAEPTCTVHGTFTVSNCSQPAFTSFSKNTVSTHVLQNSGSAASAYYHANGTDDFFSMDAEL